TVPDLEAGHSTHLECRFILSSARPVPLSPQSLTGDGSRQQVGVEVGDAAEERRPVLLDLLSTAEAPIWMNRLLARVAGVEAGDKCSQVVLVHRLVQPLDNLGR